MHIHIALTLLNGTHLHLQEYLEDYAAPDTKTIGENLIIHEMENVSNPKVKEIAKNNLENIKNGKRDFRF